MVKITPMANGKGQLSINVGTSKVKLDLTSTKSLVMSDEDYALAKQSVAPWIGVKVTVEEDTGGVQGEDTGVLSEVDAGAKKAAANKAKTPVKKAPAKKSPTKRRGFLSRAKGK